jgi:hypothetical protein
VRALARTLQLFTDRLNNQLGVYLRDRGIPISTRNKDDRLTLAKNAEKKLLPLKTTIESDQITVLEHRHSGTLCIIESFGFILDL